MSRQGIYYLGELVDTKDAGQVRAAIHNWRDDNLEKQDKQNKDKAKGKTKSKGKSDDGKKEPRKGKLFMRPAVVFPH